MLPTLCFVYIVFYILYQRRLCNVKLFYGSKFFVLCISANTMKAPQSNQLLYLTFAKRAPSSSEDHEMLLKILHSAFFQ